MLVLGNVDSTATCDVMKTKIRRITTTLNRYRWSQV